MKPLNDNVIVKRAEKNLTTPAGIILQRSDDADLADIVSVGPNVTDVVVNDRALVDWNKAVKIDKDNYKISVDNIIAVVE